MHPSRYPTDASRVGLVGTLLSGTALAWFAPLLEKNSPMLNNFEEFIASLNPVLEIPTVSEQPSTKSEDCAKVSGRPQLMPRISVFLPAIFPGMTKH